MQELKVSWYGWHKYSAHSENYTQVGYFESIISSSSTMIYHVYLFHVSMSNKIQTLISRDFYLLWKSYHGRVKMAEFDKNLFSAEILCRYPLEHLEMQIFTNFSSTIHIKIASTSTTLHLSCFDTIKSDKSSLRYDTSKNITKALCVCTYCIL